MKRWTGLIDAMRRILAIARERPHLALLGLLVAANLALRVHLSSHCSLWLDEHYTRKDASEDWATVLTGPVRDHPPLMYVAARVGMELFGTGVNGLRAASLASGCFVLLAAYWLSLEAGLGRWSALLTVAALSVSPFFLASTIEARHYGFMMLWATMATAAAVRLLRGRQTAGTWAAVVGAGSLGAFTHYAGVAYLLVLAGVLTLGFMWPRRARAAELGRVFPTAILLIGFSALVIGSLGDQLRDLGRRHHVDLVDAWRTLRPNEGFLRAVVGSFSWTAATDSPLSYLQPLLALAGLVLLVPRVGPRAALGLAALLVVPVLGGAFLPSSHFVAARYVAPSFIIYQLGSCVALLAAAAALVRIAKTRGLSKLGWPAAAVLAGGPLLLRAIEYPAGFSAGRSDYAAFQTYFNQHLARDTVLVGFKGGTARTLFQDMYPVNAPFRALERFEPVPGYRRYLVAEVHLGDPKTSMGAKRRREFEALLKKRLGLSRAEWYALPVVAVPSSRYQPPIPARLVIL